MIRLVSLFVAIALLLGTPHNTDSIPYVNVTNGNSMQVMGDGVWIPSQVSPAQNQYHVRLADTIVALTRRKTEKPVSVPVILPVTSGKLSTNSGKISSVPSKVVSTTGWRYALASDYGIGDHFLGKHMACGGSLTLTDLTFANRTLPCGTRVEFQYNGNTVIGRVTDRGPYCCGRDFDFGPAVAHALNFRGVGVVKWRVVK